ncbi:hypothetical protein ACH4E7_11790 [Kitasatospora sp. NPDC018058]|uniref:hypothetical protein n=1 Tax=Kitasatospora sp. NPDC018058 TaxID=3364025 RepID=UPI0037C19C76
MDGTTLDLADTDANDEHFGRPGTGRGIGAFPQARLMALAECGTHAVFGAVVGALSAGEQALSHVCRQGGHGVSEGDDVLVTERRHLGDGSTRGRRKRFGKLGRSGDRPSMLLLHIHDVGVMVMSEPAGRPSRAGELSWRPVRCSSPLSDVGG